MKQCPKCKEEIADDAKKCKHCHADLRNWFVQHKIWTAILAVIVLAIIGSAIGGSKTNTGGGSSNTTPAKEETKKFNVDDIYSKITTGMTEAEVKGIVTVDPINCTESEIQNLGTSKVCTYGNVFVDKGAIVVTFSNGKVFTKTKSQY